MQHIQIGSVPYDMIIGEVVYFHFRKGLVNSRFHVDAVKLDPLGRHSGGGGYVRMTDRFEMPRLPVPDGKESV